MGREPPSRQRRVALAGVDVHLVIGVFAIAVDDVFAVECIVDSSAAFAGITYRCPVPRSVRMNTGGLSPLYIPVD